MARKSNQEKVKKTTNVVQAISFNGNQPNDSTTEMKHENGPVSIVEDEQDESVRVLRKLVQEAQGPFHGSVTTVKLLVGLSRYSLVHPFGTEFFGEAIVTIVREHDPFKTEHARVSLVFETDDGVGNFGTLFGIVKSVTAKDVVRCLKKSKHNLGCLMPRVSMRLTYLNPPTSQ